MLETDLWRQKEINGENIEADPSTTGSILTRVKKLK